MAEMQRGKQAVLDIGKKLRHPTLAEQELWAKAAEPTFQTWMDDAEELGADPQVIADIFAEWKLLRKKYTK